MWRLVLMFSFCATAQASSGEITVTCNQQDYIPMVSDKSPARLAALNVTTLPRENDYLLNISWAISPDASIQYLTGTHLIVDGEADYICTYKPSLANFSWSKKKWFYHEMPTGHGNIIVQASNLPLPPFGSDPSYLDVSVSLPTLKHSISEHVMVPTGETTVKICSAEPLTSPWRTELVTVAIFGVLGGLLMLSSCYIIYKTFLGDKNPTSAMFPVPVLMVYSAENPAFQQAVVALAEFLQLHGGCSVAVDMWQQGKIAELGPMRWLVKQIEAADQVLIVCPQVEADSLQTNQYPSKDGFLQPSIPAASRDLYLLILNIVASHAKNSSELAKFWVVQLGEDQDKKNLPLQLRVCKTFCLMGGLNKLCRSLHSRRQNNKKLFDVLFKPGNSYNERSRVKLGEAVNKLIRHQPSICREMEPLKLCLPEDFP